MFNWAETEEEVLEWNIFVMMCINARIVSLTEFLEAEFLSGLTQAYLWQREQVNYLEITF